MLYREIIAVCSQIHTKHINKVCGQNVELYIKTQSVPHSKHSVPVIKTSQLMLYREIIAVCSQIHTKHITTPCGQNFRFVHFKPSSSTYIEWPLGVRRLKCPALAAYCPNRLLRVWCSPTAKCAALSFHCSLCSLRKLFDITRPLPLWLYVLHSF
jgi:hypothetical protein